ncbi:MAG: nucleoside 2-deoxyribosyltransferase [Candidatus Nanopelagicales bacterium]
MAISPKKTKQPRLSIYMAGPLFNLADQAQNEALALAIEELLPVVTCILPQNSTQHLLPDMRAVTEACFAQIRAADLVCANLDGADADGGTCVEVGYAFALKKPIIGYRSDCREGEVEGVSSMLRYSVNTYIQLNAFHTTTKALAQSIAAAIQATSYPGIKS